MISYDISEDNDEEIEHENNSVQGITTLQKNRIETRRASTVGNLYNQCTAGQTITTCSSTSSTTSSQFTSASTSSSAAYKQVSVSMSMERRDSIQYIVNPAINKLTSALPKGNVPPACIIPAGQNTVIHLDNYMEFMSQRVTTTRTAVCKEVTTANKNARVGREEMNDPTSLSSGGSGISRAGGELDISVQILNSTSKNQANRKPRTMQRKKLMGPKSLNVPSKIRSRKESLAIEMPPPLPPPPKKEILETTNSENTIKPETSTKPKPILKKSRRTITKKLKETKSGPQEKHNLPANTPVQQKEKMATNKRKTGFALKNTRFTQTDDESHKILKPCNNLIQNKKCPQQLTCQYLHSDFPCKYYYSDLICPDGAKCLFMHNGPLSNQLMNALQSHVLDLLSGFKKPTATERFFVQQIQTIENLSKRLKDFENTKFLTTSEVIEVMDDDDDDEDAGHQILVMDNSNQDVNESDLNQSQNISLNPLQNTSQTDHDNFQNQSVNSEQNTSFAPQVLALVPYHNRLNNEYQIYKEANNVLNTIEDNLNRLKTSPNMSAREKCKELENIYELLMRQDKLFVINDKRVSNLSSAVTTVLRNDNNPGIFNNINMKQNLEQQGQQNIVLVDPEIVNSIHSTMSQDSTMTLTDDEDDNFGENVSSDITPLTQSDVELQTTYKNDKNQNDTDKISENNDKLQEKPGNINVTTTTEEDNTNSNNKTSSLLDMIDSNLTIWEISKPKDSNPIVQDHIQMNKDILHTQEEFIDNFPLTIDNTELQQNTTLDTTNKDETIENNSEINISSKELPELEEGEIIDITLEDSGQLQEQVKTIATMKIAYTPDEEEDDDVETISKISTLLQEQEMSANNSTLESENDKPTSFNTTITSILTNLSEQEDTDIITLQEKEHIIEKQTLQTNFKELSENNETISNIQNFIEQPNIEAITTKEIEMIDNNLSGSLDNEENLSQINDPLSEDTSLELAISVNEKEIIEGGGEDDEESPPYENITSIKDKTTDKTPSKVVTTKTADKLKNRIRLRSHTQQDNEELHLNAANTSEQQVTTTIETKTIKPRRLRLPKPTNKTVDKSVKPEYKIDPELINKLIHESKNENTTLQDVEAPLMQNVILTKRFMKRARARLDQETKLEINLNENETNSNILNPTSKELKLTSFPKENDKEMLNKLENFEVTFCTQTSLDSQHSLNLSHDPLDNESNTTENVTPTDSTSILSKPIKNVTQSKINLKRRVSFENHASTSAAKQQFLIGNPHVVLTKIKPSLLPATAQKQMQAETNISVSTSLKSPTNAVITSCSPSSSSAIFIADDKSCHIVGQKRRSFTPESDLDASLKADKISKVNSLKTSRKINLTRQRYNSEQSNSERDDFNTDSSDEKPTKADALQSSTPTTDNKRAFKPSTTSTHHVTTQKHHHHQQAHHHVHYDEQHQQENESDLRQQIENVSNKSDLELQTQQHQKQQQLPQLQKEIETTYKNSNNLAHKQPQHHQQTQIEIEKIANTCNPYGNIQKVVVVVVDKDKQKNYQPPPPLEQTDENGENPTTNLSNKYSNEPISPAVLLEDKKLEENIEYIKYATIFNKLSSSHTARRQINFENSSVNITPIASPTYVGDGGDTIASPSPVKEEIAFDYRLEVDGRMTYPPMRYILHKIDLDKININKPTSIDKLTKTTHLDPRIFRSHLKKPIISYTQTITPQKSQAVVPLAYGTTNSALSSTSSSSSSCSAYKTSSVSSYDPRSRTAAIMPATPPLSNQTALSCCDVVNPSTALVPLGSSGLTTPTAVGVPLHHTHSQHPHAHHHHAHVHSHAPQPTPQQTPNMLLYGCLQRSPWYQSLMSPMKIQINQSISQLVRAINNFQRERLLNPEIVFDVFKIDIAGELLEIMRNLGIFVDENGIINEQRHVPTYAGRSCLNSSSTTAQQQMPLNATYSFIQQVLTPSSLGGTSMMTTASSASTYNAAAGDTYAQYDKENVPTLFVNSSTTVTSTKQYTNIDYRNLGFYKPLNEMN